MGTVIKNLYVIRNVLLLINQVRSKTVVLSSLLFNQRSGSKEYILLTFDYNFEFEVVLSVFSKRLHVRSCREIQLFLPQFLCMLPILSAYFFHQVISK